MLHRTELVSHSNTPAHILPARGPTRIIHTPINKSKTIALTYVHMMLERLTNAISTYSTNTYNHLR